MTDRAGASLQFNAARPQAAGVGVVALGLHWALMGGWCRRGRGRIEGGMANGCLRNACNLGRLQKTDPAIPLPGKWFRPCESAGRAGRIRKGIAFPRPRRPRLCRTLSARMSKASARPGGCEAPALGQVGRCPGALAPGGRAARAPHGRGDGPGQNERGLPFVTSGTTRRAGRHWPDMRFRENNSSIGSTEDRQRHSHQAVQLPGQHCLLTV